MTALLENQVRIGGDPSGLRECALLRNELAKLTHPACPDVDWAQVEQLSLDLFEKNGADLQTTACFALACSHLRGVDGMTQGVMMIDAVCRVESGLWPPRVSARLEILGWLFAQWQRVLRSLAITRLALPALAHLDKELERLARLLVSQRQEPPVTLLALSQQLGGLMQRLARRTEPDGPPPVTSPPPALAPLVPVVTEPIAPSPEAPAEYLPTVSPVRRRTLFWWLLGVLAFIALACGAKWWM
ncbi:type VI secretion system ImpA family N-terminal domain-containing protein [Pseudomonas sp. P9_2]|uniref:type VI secretion system ImpA family N-terminal domain-containing protein n=1 Tax=Pseudomonas sp. P9_2 TaxID=3043447 RepID=UPI0013D9C29D|nr:type VI secretion system ImpA family N-terminal domain-containing protein [Pseudomonas sp. P9_2]WPN51982.1 type VI secretion system ImpA family N-terminal domain-containing protein [Pseudomonas sp. P9_2]